MPPIVRTKRDGCYTIGTTVFGHYLKRCEDPDASVEQFTRQEFNEFHLAEDFRPIPFELWTRWVQLCFHFVDKVTSHAEVSCRLLLKEDDKSQWRIAIPRQYVSGDHVDVPSFDGSIDIATGETIESFPPPGWISVGSSHSHNTMGAFFSATDDRSEIGDPGMHLVVGSISIANNNYRIASSITANNRRFLVPHEQLVVANNPGVEAPAFHERVLENVSIERTPLEDRKTIQKQLPSYTWTPKGHTTHEPTQPDNDIFWDAEGSLIEDQLKEFFSTLDDAMTCAFFDGDQEILKLLGARLVKRLSWINEYMTLQRSKSKHPPSSSSRKRTTKANKR